MLAGHLAGTDDAGLLDQLVSHRALACREVTRRGAMQGTGGP